MGHETKTSEDVLVTTDEALLYHYVKNQNNLSRVKPEALE